MPITARLDPDASRRLRVAAAHRGTTQGRILDELILANLPPADPLPTPDVRRAGQAEPFTPETLKQELVRYGVSQAALAAALGLNQKSVNEWFLRGRIPQQSALRNPRTPNLTEICGNLPHMPYTRKMGMNAPKPVYR